MMRRWFVPILVLPGTVLVFIPAILLGLKGGPEIASMKSVGFWAGLVFAGAGAGLSGGSMRLFFRHGEGTPAPWEPPQRFVVQGLYRHVRNPMIVGVILLLIAEALIFQSVAVGIWAVVFFVGNAIYFPAVEEPGLRQRFGKDYETYCANVGRWVPRLKPWQVPESGSLGEK